MTVITIIIIMRGVWRLGEQRIHDTIMAGIYIPCVGHTWGGVDTVGVGSKEFEEMGSVALIVEASVIIHHCL